MLPLAEDASRVRNMARGPGNAATIKYSCSGHVQMVLFALNPRKLVKRSGMALRVPSVLYTGFIILLVALLSILNIVYKTLTFSK